MTSWQEPSHRFLISVHACDTASSATVLPLPRNPKPLPFAIWAQIGVLQRASTSSCKLNVLSDEGTIMRCACEPSELLGAQHWCVCLNLQVGTQTIEVPTVFGVKVVEAVDLCRGVGL